MSVISAISSQLYSWTFDIKPDITTKFVAECLCLTLFQFIGSILPTAYANGIALMSLVYFSAKISGAHLNPVISFMFFILGHINPVELIAYILAQIVGGIFGSLWIYALVPGLSLRTSRGASQESIVNVKNEFDGCFVPTSTLSLARVFGWEAIGTFMFVLPVFSVVWYTQNKKGYGATGPIVIGISLMASAFAVGRFTGASLNPARTLASYIVFNCSSNVHVLMYILGEFTGALVATLFIIPWYGISHKPWYSTKWLIDLHGRFKKYQPSIVIKTTHHDASIDPKSNIQKIHNNDNGQSSNANHTNHSNHSNNSNHGDVHLHIGV